MGRCASCCLWALLSCSPAPSSCCCSGCCLEGSCLACSGGAVLPYRPALRCVVSCAALPRDLPPATPCTRELSSWWPMALSSLFTIWKCYANSLDTFLCASRRHGMMVFSLGLGWIGAKWGSAHEPLWDLTLAAVSAHFLRWSLGRSCTQSF